MLALNSMELNKATDVTYVAKTVVITAVDRIVATNNVFPTAVLS